RAQTEHRGVPGPVRLLLGGETHRPVFFSTLPARKAAPKGASLPPASIVNLHLVPKLCSGTHSWGTPFPVWARPRNAFGAQPERRGPTGPVRALLGGVASPAGAGRGLAAERRQEECKRGGRGARFQRLQGRAERARGHGGTSFGLMARARTRRPADRR